MKNLNAYGQRLWKAGNQLIYFANHCSRTSWKFDPNKLYLSGKLLEDVGCCLSVARNIEDALPRLKQIEKNGLANRPNFFDRNVVTKIIERLEREK